MDATVHRVADNRMADRAQVHANLMCSSRVNGDSCQSDAGADSCHPEPGKPLFTARPGRAKPSRLHTRAADWWWHSRCYQGAGSVPVATRRSATGVRRTR